MAGRPSVESWCPKHLVRQRADWKYLVRYFQESGNISVGMAAIDAGQAYMQALCKHLESR